MSEAAKPEHPFEKLRAFAKQVLAVPKKEVDRALANERNIRAAKRKARK
jgi:hypothetical protein